ncbi:hypothetical protein NQ318_001890 [Aromia moschata]|uniref:tRNA (guanine(37)-N1)-methyltransferase n=1 Tax=Aromia moschata TaxID=1265417 RepID=A0AAV8Z3Q6_9CUCU|nr:hypothetical protein NQ318_001890 [Aromia moschata]
MTELDKRLFDKKVQITCLTLTGIKVSQVLPIIKKYLFKTEHFKPIQHGENGVNIFLNPEVVKEWSSFPTETQKALKDLNLSEANLKSADHTLTYDNFSVEDVLKAILPTDKEGKYLKFHKSEVLFDKVPGCKSVVNKVNMIDNTYRNFKMEVLKGVDDMLTTVKENSCTFKFDFSKVYWNSRLCTEHERIVKMLNPGDVLFDVFAGVGPFALPAAKKKCQVYANDLNPESFDWLVYNAKANKIDDKYFKSFNKDGGDFIKQDMKELLPNLLRDKKNVYIVMNLPALAVEFLSNFVGLLSESAIPETVKPPTVFVYCFAKGEDYNNIAKNLVVDGFGFDASDKIVELFRVRTVSSMKEMMRVKIRLDGDVLSGDVGKKRKLEDGLDVERMGKNKKINNVFKVAGAKSLKLKAKAKAIKNDLKNIKVKTKIKTTEIDKALVLLQDKVRQSPAPVQKPEVSQKSKLPTVNKEQALETQKKSNEAMENLDKMQL